MTRTTTKGQHVCFIYQISITRLRGRVSLAKTKAVKEHHLEYEEWEFVPAFPHHPGEHGLPEDPEELEEHAADIKIEAICGGIDESQPVEQYDGTLGVTTAFVDEHQGPVGQVQWNNNLGAVYTNPGNVSGVRWCSGTLISCNLFLSAGHCFDSIGGGWNRPLINGTNTPIPPAEIAQNMHVNFNYQVDPNGNLRQEREFAIVELMEHRNNGLDYAIARLDGNPGAEFGFTPVSSTDANQNDVLCIIQHPAGLPKRIEAGTLFHLHDTRAGYDDIDTLGGSSGSGVLSLNGTIAGVHTNGGCNAAATGHNHGQRISSIIAASPIVSDLISNKQKFMDDGCRIKPGPVVGKHVFQDFDIWKVFSDSPLKGFLDGKIKFLDDGKVKHVDDVKQTSYDIGPWLGRVRNRLGGLFRGGVLGAGTPFILSTPHHSAIAGEQGGIGSLQSPGDLLGEYESRLAEIERVLEQGSREMASLRELYEGLRAEYSEAMESSREGAE